MRIDVLTILPDLVTGAIGHSIIGRACAAGQIDVRAVDIRGFADSRHHTTDDTPCGGGGGMIMKVEPVAAAIASVQAPDQAPRVILTEPSGRRFDQSVARELSAEPHLVFVCGRYEGMDDRVREHLVTDVLSIGDYVLTGGELPALVMIDAIARLLPGVLGNKFGAESDSFGNGLLEHPQYTRPRTFEGWAVPDILVGGNHAGVERWRRYWQLRRTREMRPDLWERFEPSADDLKLLADGEPIA